MKDDLTVILIILIILMKSKFLIETELNLLHNPKYNSHIFTSFSHVLPFPIERNNRKKSYVFFYKFIKLNVKYSC
jgi:hypothetical protein